jgi:hypothetical protein
MSHSRRIGTGLESLERRELLAGNVTVTVSLVESQSNGILKIVGDNSSNTIAIWSGANPYQVVVAGGLDAAGQPTTVNGQLGPVVFNNVTRGVSANTGGGNDKVLFTKFSLPAVSGIGGVFVGGGSQNDVITFRGKTPQVADLTLNQNRAIPYGPLHIVPDVTVDDDRGSDAVRVFDVDLGAKLGIRFFSGNDVVQIDGASNQIRGTLRLDLYGGNDLVRIRRANIGHDFQAFFSAETGPANATTTVDLFDVSVANHVDLRFKDLNSKVSIDGGTAPAQRSSAASLVIQGGNRDTVSIQRSNIRVASIATAGQDDNVAIVDSVFEQLAVYLQGGNDVVSLKNTRVNRRTFLDGGAGTNQFNNQGGNALAGLTQVHFAP